ncbi:methyltransferase domain-containing protein [Vibrio astriarenae]|uniref:Methyltransferase domain-containing protein n=1 Tax=Vibrio astriarenae TaxID=1481923 RepID=A0A7Z2T465_9VIBR|nr:class I SAM-dependent methyltransferase [Vibrio astriarenae]QIA63960.1 methyltransferase domain-containing protein [Vibrio astriarenae]
MKPARSKKELNKPTTWSELQNGHWVSESIQLRLDEWCPKLFGYHLLKLGGLSSELASCHCNIQHQVNLDRDNPIASVIADPFELPFIEKSFDAVILAHQLDFCDDPHRLLREIDRIMIDDGYLILTGFNPLSLTGISSLLPWRKNNLPWSGRMFTPSRIKDWLGVLNYEVIECDGYAVFPYQFNRTFWTWLENSLGQWCRPAGSLYFIVARKRTCPLKPIKPHWQLKRRLSPLVNYSKIGSRVGSRRQL